MRSLFLGAAVEENSSERSGIRREIRLSSKTTTTTTKTTTKTTTVMLLLFLSRHASSFSSRTTVPSRTAPSFLPSRGRSLLSTSSSSSSSSLASSVESSTTTSTPRQRRQQEPLRLNLRTLPKSELVSLLENWKHPRYRADQITRWVRDRGASSFDEMLDLPSSLRESLKEHCVLGSLEIVSEQISKDGTVKRAYRLASDGKVVESVLMPYEDGRYTACVSSQAGCAMGCVFCATGQMGFARQLTADEIFEQTARFAAELRAAGRNERLSNVVLMGMGEPLANYRHVMAATRRMNEELGIGARRITVSTVGVVPNIRKLAREPLQVRLAVSLHCADDAERTALLPANRRYGGLDELMSAVRYYVDETRRRVTFEWALIEGTNDDPATARKLGRLLERFDLRADLCHVNLIPLNPTGGYGGSPSGRRRVEAFVRTLEKEFGVSATPRMRRGIDIDAGCGQLTTKINDEEEEKKKDKSEREIADTLVDPVAAVGVYEDHDEEEEEQPSPPPPTSPRTVDLDDESHEFQDDVFDSRTDRREIDRILSLVRSSSPAPVLSSPPTAMAKTDVDVAVVEQSVTAVANDDGDEEEDARQRKKRRRKLLKNLKAIDNLTRIQSEGRIPLNEEQSAKIAKGVAWRAELRRLESVDD